MKRSSASSVADTSEQGGVIAMVTPSDRESPYWLLKVSDLLRAVAPDQSIVITTTKTGESDV